MHDPNLLNSYKFLLSYQNQIARRRAETPDEFISRINLIHRLQYQIEQTTIAIKHEVQPKKKYIYNTRVNGYKKDLEELLKGDE